MKQLFSILIIILVSSLFGDSINKIMGYDEDKNSFFYKNDIEPNLSAQDLILKLKKTSSLKKDRKIRKNISKYEKKFIKVAKIKQKHKFGSPHPEGRKFLENRYLINNPNRWYKTGAFLCSIIIYPEIAKINNLLRFRSAEIEMDNTSIKYMRKFGEKTLLPGIIIFSIGYFGSTYKFGQKETIIKNSDIILPKISDFLNQNEVKKIIDMYNNVNN